MGKKDPDVRRVRRDRYVYWEIRSMSTLCSFPG